jgi:hypothetical protein
MTQGLIAEQLIKGLTIVNPDVKKWLKTNRHTQLWAGH